MKVARKGDLQFQETVEDGHKTQLQNHERNVAFLDATNKALQDDHKATVEHVKQRNSKLQAEHRKALTDYDKAKKRLRARVRKPLKPAEPLLLEEPEPPELLEIPPAPQKPDHPLEIFAVEQFNEPKTVQTEWGSADAEAGMLVLVSNLSGKSIVVHPNDFQSQYQEV